MTTFKDLQWKKLPVLNDGFVCLVDVMGNDSSVTQAARVSYGNDQRGVSERHIEALEKLFGKREIPQVPGPPTGLYDQYSREEHAKARKEVEAGDRNLIRYMMRHHHGTPFEMAEVKLLVRVPMDTWRQWIRHRTANVNEYSTRYTEAIDARQTTLQSEWRLQSGSNKQGSSGFLDELGGKVLSDREGELHEMAQEVYQQRLDYGVAREQARKDLPLSTYTEAYWKCDLRNIFHFLGLRMDSHAQWEIRQYANIIGEQIIKPLFPLCWEAFEDYHLNAMHLTVLDIEAAKAIQLSIPKEYRDESNIRQALSDFSAKNGGSIPDEWLNDRNREREECLDKLRRLGIL